jgi:hypothetical protein
LIIEDLGTDMKRPRIIALGIIMALSAAAFFWRAPVSADGMVVRPRNYKGSLEERAQEAIIIFTDSKEAGGAVEDLILKISVQADEPLENFAWIVPFPTEPKVEKEDAALFKECFDYVQSWKPRPKSVGDASPFDDGPPTPKAEAKVEVLSRQIVGSYDVAVVKENVAGALAEWLDKEGFHAELESKKAKKIVEYYRDKNYVFACMKVKDAGLKKDVGTDLHPLRFTFKTGGTDGIYFPMKLSGLSQTPFDVNLYVFYKAWLNDQISDYGYVHRGFTRSFRDFDTPKCVPNGGKSYANPENDQYFAGRAGKIKTLSALINKLHPEDKYYLTNIQAFQLKPDSVADAKNDLWLFPYYTDKKFVPIDAREGGVAAGELPSFASKPAIGKPERPIPRTAPRPEETKKNVGEANAFD